MTKVENFFIGLLSAASFTFAPLAVATAVTITNGSYRFESLEAAPAGTGLGSYNVILFTHANGGAENASGGVNVDDANRMLPTGIMSSSNALFWMTSIGDLRAFYNLQFGGALNVNNIVLFLDVNEEGSGPNAVNLDTLTIYHKATTSPNHLIPALDDLSADDQESITAQADGFVLAQLTSTPQSLDQIAAGGGSDDWVIFTFINPYDAAFSPSDSLLFNLKLSKLDNGPESLSISGKLTNCDFDPRGCGSTTGGTTGTATANTTADSTGRSAGSTADITEPAPWLLLIIGLLGLSRLRGKPMD